MEGDGEAALVRGATHSYGARMVRMRLEPEDDYLHPVEAASNFNESRYYNFFDPERPAWAAGSGWATGPTRATPR